MPGIAADLNQLTDVLVDEGGGGERFDDGHVRLVPPRASSVHRLGPANGPIHILSCNDPRGRGIDALLYENRF
jgi:hypothetical protein